MAAENPFLELAAPGIGRLAPYEPGRPGEEIERNYGLRDVVKLASNENPLGAPPAAAAAVTAAADLALYPDGACFTLRRRLARHLDVAPEQLILGNGSNEVLVMLAETVLTREHNAVMDQYSFVVYRLAAQACGAESRFAASFSAEDESPLGHDLDALRAAIDRHTRLVFVANPNNPTGSYVSPAALKKFIAEVPQHVLVVLDEAYLEYARESGEPDALGWLPDHRNLVVVRTFSKAYGLAGLRVGYAVCHADLAELVNRLRQPFNVNSLAQRAATAALDEQAWLARCVTANNAQRQLMAAGLAELGYPSLPSRGNFLLVDFGTASQSAAANEHLLRHGLIVRPVANYGLPRYLRITVGTAPQVAQLLEALKSFAATAA